MLRRVIAFLEFLETWKCRGKLLRSVKSQEKRPKVGERSGNLCNQADLIVAAQQNAGNKTVLRSSCNSPVLYSYCNSFFTRDVHGIFGLINVHLFDILTAVSSRKGWDFCLSGEW